MAIGVGFNDVAMLGVPSGTGMSLPIAMGGGRRVHIDPTDAWPTRGLAIGADDIATEIVARLMLRLQERR